MDGGWRGDISQETPRRQRVAIRGITKVGRPGNRNGTAKGGVWERRAKQVGAPISWEIVARNSRVIKKNPLLPRYSFERVRKSFKRGRLYGRWGEKVTIRKTRSRTEIRPGQMSHNVLDCRRPPVVELDEGWPPTPQSWSGSRPRPRGCRSFRICWSD